MTSIRRNTIKPILHCYQYCVQYVKSDVTPCCKTVSTWTSTSHAVLLSFRSSLWNKTGILKINSFCCVIAVLLPVSLFFYQIVFVLYYFLFFFFFFHTLSRLWWSWFLSSLPNVCPLQHWLTCNFNSDSFMLLAFPTHACRWIFGPKLAVLCW